METKQALTIIKQVLDAAAKSGIFENMDSAFVCADAYNHIFKKLSPDKDQKTDEQQ